MTFDRFVGQYDANFKDTKHYLPITDDHWDLSDQNSTKKRYGTVLSTSFPKPDRVHFLSVIFDIIV